MIKFENSDEYQVYENVRTKKGGGGLATLVRKNLHPAWVRQGDDSTEALTVQVSVQEMNIRITNAYGPQEYDDNDKKSNFWKYLEDEIFISDQSGAGCMIMMDGNSWLGPLILRGDPHPQNTNGKLFEQFLARNTKITLLNTEEICQGLITRSREVNGKIEKSAIDFILVCEKMIPYLKSMSIDEDKVHALTNFSSKDKGKKAKQSDHNPLIANFELHCNIESEERQTVFNYKNAASMKKFKDITTKTTSFSDCFNNDLPFLHQVKKWMKILNRSIFK